MIECILFELAIGYFFFGGYILLKNKSSLKNRMFFSFCMNLTCWALGDALMIISHNQSDANFWRIIAALGWCSIYSVWLDFTVLVKEENKKWMMSVKRLLIYVPGIVFFIGNVLYDPNKVLINVNGMWRDVYPLDYFQILYKIYCLAFGVISILIIYKWGKNSESKRSKFQSEIIVKTAVIMLIVMIIIHSIPPFFGINIVFYRVMAFPIAMVGMEYVIIKYNMMSITTEIASEYIMDHMSDPVIILEIGFLIKEVNIAAIEITGYCKEELIGFPMQKVISSTNLNKAAISDFTESGAVKNHEIELFTKSNKYIPCLASASSIYNASKEFIGIVCVFHDITDRKNAENILVNAHQLLESKVAERTEELEKINSLLQDEISERKKNEERNKQIAKMEALGTLAGGIAHDFNNILAGIIGYTQLTLEDLDAESDLQDNLLEVLKLGERSKKLISQILTFSRKNIIEPEIVDMRAIIEEILSMIKTTITSTIQIKYDFHGKSAYVLAAQTEMQQLIMNLCVNAQLAMSANGGILEVRMTEIIVEQQTTVQYQIISPGAYIKIQVIDNGCGMEKPTMDRIFEPFYTTRGVQGGTGLGLSVVHGIVRSCRGIITVDSEINKGSVFTVYLPQVKYQLNKESLVDESIKSSQARILFVDDEEAIANTTEKILQREGYIVTVALDGESALKIFRNNMNSFDIVITDQSMPDMTGSLLIKKLKEIRPDIPVILCSGYINELDDERINQLSIAEVLLKPVSKNQYVKAIGYILRGEKHA